MRMRLPLALASSLLAVSQVAANPRKDRAALAQLDAAYQPAGKLAQGPDRTQQACADAARLHAAGDALSQNRAPAGAAVDDLTWMLAVSDLAAVLDKLVAVCKTADRKISVDLQGKRFETADQIVDRLDHRMRAVLDRARPRDLPPAMKQFRTTLDRMTAASRRLCARHGKLAKLLPELARPPAKANAARWQQGSADLQASLDEVEQFGCGTPRGADEEIAGALNEVHDRYYELVLLVPPRD